MANQGIDIDYINAVIDSSESLIGLKAVSVETRPGSSAGCNYHGDLLEVCVQVNQSQPLHWMIKTLKPDPGSYGNIIGAFDRESRQWMKLL